MIVNNYIAKLTSRDNFYFVKMIEKILNILRNIENPQYRRVYWLIFKYLNIYKSLHLNFRMLPLRQAIKLPIWIYGRVSFVSLRGKIEIKSSKISIGMIHLGMPEDTYFNPRLNGIINIEGTLAFREKCTVGCGFNFRIYPTGYIILGNRSHFGAKIEIISKNEIEIGDFSRIAFETVIMDSGFHYVVNLETNIVNNVDSSVKIGNHNWIGNKTSINKGTKTPNNIIVASQSLLNKDYTNYISEYSLIGGMPAKLLKNNVTRIWNEQTEKKLREYFIKTGELFLIYENDPIV